MEGQLTRWILTGAFLCLLYGYSSGQTKTEIAVMTSAGNFVGLIETVKDSNNMTVKVKKYLGIPYAEPPVDELRFQGPKKKKYISGTYEALEYKSICPQLDAQSAMGNQAEDCLYLNIFVPDGDKGRAVMIFLHGGDFRTGSANEYDHASHLATRGDVIVVTLNYRLGPFGFLDVYNGNAEGNAGLYDQKLAFEWVHKNIDAFGGDTERVTIFGLQAGAVSSILHALSPSYYNKGERVFQRVISESGYLLSPFSWFRQKGTAKTAWVLAHYVGCYKEDVMMMMACLRNTSWKEIASKTNEMAANPEFRNDAYFYPFFGDELIWQEPKQLLTKSMMSKSNAATEVQFFQSLDFLSGYNKYEGALMMQFIFGIATGHWDMESFKPSMEDMKYKYIPSAMRVILGRNISEAVNKMVNAEYVNWTDPFNPDQSRLQFVKMFTDMNSVVSTIGLSHLHNLNNGFKKSYVYQHLAMPTSRIIPYIASWVPGPTIYDELGFVFGAENKGDWRTELSNKMIAYWTNFAKTGNPNYNSTVMPSTVMPMWPAWDSMEQHYIAFDRDLSSKSIHQYLGAKETNFWLKVFPGIIEAIDGHGSTTCPPYVNGSDKLSMTIGSLLLAVAIYLFMN